MAAMAISKPPSTSYGDIISPRNAYAHTVAPQPRQHGGGDGGDGGIAAHVLDGEDGQMLAATAHVVGGRAAGEVHAVAERELANPAKIRNSWGCHV